MADIKIRDVGSAQTPPRIPTGIERHGTENRSQAFKTELSDINRANYEQKLNEMSETIINQGKVLGKRMDIVELKRYKAMISEFMQEVVRFAFEFNKKSTLDSRGHHRIYAIIKRLNKRLEELTQQILATERDNIEILKMIDDICGMIIDLLL